MSFSSMLSCILPASSFWKSKTLLISSVSLFTFLLAIFKKSRCFSLIFPTAPSTILVMAFFIHVKGVLSSCDTVDMNCDFISIVSLSFSSAFLCSVTSIKTPIEPVVSPWEFSKTLSETLISISSPFFFIILVSTR